jgi:bifunctional DNase/RNase
MNDYTVMAKVQPVIEIQVKAVVPTSGGCAVFLGNDRKVFVIYIDHGVGLAISMALRQETRERPQTHELIGSVLAGLGAKVDRVVINHFSDGVYFARLILLAENELYERKIVEIDARPSDSLALAVQAGAPIYLTREVWDAVEDVTELFNKMEKDGFSGGNLEPDS